MQLGHIVDWRSEPSLAMRDDNLRSECQPCNLAEKNRRNAQPWRDGDAEIVLIVGPPGADLVSAAGEGMVVDYGRIVAENPALDHRQVMALRNQMLSDVRAARIDAERVWLTSSNPDAVETFPHHRVVTVDPGRAAALAARPDMADQIAAWYENRTPAGFQEV